MEFPGGRTAWVYFPSGGLEPREPEFTFHNLEVTLDEASSTLTSAPKRGDDIVLTGVRARAGRRATENLWKESRLVTIRVRSVTSGWGIDGIERIEGLVRYGDWLLPVVAFVRIGVETPYVGALEISNVATYSPATDGDVPSSNLHEH